MSTTTNSPATPGTPGALHDAVSPQQRIHSYDSHRASRNNRQSHAESSTSGSRWSAIDPQSRSPSNFGASSSYLGSDDGKTDRPASNVLPRRNHHRSSGGFLLELATPSSSRLSRTLLSRSQKDSKGKRKSDNSEISVSKRRSQASTLENGSLFPSSPLTVNVHQDQEHNTPQDKFGNFKAQQEQNVASTDRYGTPTSQQSGRPSTGTGTDSAQIVDMALRLSEGRRRQASGKRFVSGELPDSRVISSPTHQLQNPPKSLGQYLASQNAGNISPIPASPVRDNTEADAGNSMLMNRPSTPYTPQSRLTTEDSTLEISRATIARVEKARIYLELAYEHRRLLSHLPPIRRPGTTTRDGGEVPQSKIYNPLQYARNRKLRLREKSDINAEGEGWYDVEKVRAWVDAVSNSHSETSHDPMECVRLPPLSLQKRGEEDELENAFHSPRAANQHRHKPRRPKSDWVTHPGDLIADAFWLEQGLNKTKIQDRDNHPIYPADTPFKFSGWRNRTPGEVPERLQQPTPPPEEPSLIQPAAPLAGAPELPTFRSAHRKPKDVSRGRKRSKIKDSIAKAQSDSRRRALGLLDSSTGSDSDVSLNKSDDEGLQRGRTRSLKEFDLPDGDPFGHPATSARSQHAINGTNNSSDVNLSEHSLKRSSVDHARLTNILKRNSMLKSSSNERSNSRSGTKKHRLFQSSKDFHEDERHGQSSAEYDSASPNSPINYGLPSIAINLDAPISRSPSPTKRSRSKFFSTHKDKPKNAQHEKVESVDFAGRGVKSHSRDASIDAGNRRNSSNQTSRGTSPLTRGTSPFTKNRQNSALNEETVVNASYPRSNPVSRVSTRSNAPSSHDQSSRIRGMFKGGRIAELVGNEVSRVGDFIWKREPPHTYRHPLSGSDASFRSYYHSDTDEETHGAQIFKTPTRDARPSVTTQSSGGGRKSFESSRNNEAPQLHHPNLPSFTSPFQRDRERQEKKPDLLNPGVGVDSGDHISRQAAQHRARSKSPRLEGLAPPKLEITAPQSASIAERKNSYGFGEALARSQSASRMFNDAMKQSGEDVTRKDSLAISNPFRKSLTDNLQVDSLECIRKRNISRLEALLLISAVKAKNISASYEQIPPEPSRFLQEMTAGSNRLPRVRRRDEYIFAAREIISALEGQTDQINNQLHVFSDKGVAKLHRDIQGIEDQIENSITPRVRATADSAAELSVKLTTTSTQAVKGLQDIVTEAFRMRRRGPFRWVRLLGYKLIEWIVVGLLWFIWAIVTFCKIFIGLFRGVGRLTTWLLWVDR